MTRNKILVADDQDYIIELYKRIFGAAFKNYSCEFFENGDALANRLEQGVIDVCLVLTDNQMPCIWGSEIIQKYARKQGFEGIRFVLNYGGDKKIGEQAILEGAYGYLLKEDFSGIESFVQDIRNFLDFSER